MENITHKISSRGFTLIELLVVIAIIGILAATVLASINSSRSKGSDANIKSNMANAKSQAEIFYSNNASTYGAGSFALNSCPTTAQVGTLFADTKMIDILNSAITQSGGAANTRCVSTTNAWAIAVQLRSGGTAGDSIPDSWCVSSGAAARAYTYTSGQTIANAITGTTCN